jgi:hypothetical protein
MTDPADDLAAYATIEGEVAKMLGIDLSADIDQATRLRLGRGTALRIEIDRYDHAQRDGLAIDVAARNRASELLESMLAPDAPAPAFDLKLIPDNLWPSFAAACHIAYGRPLPEQYDTDAKRLLAETAELERLRAWRAEAPDPDEVKRLRRTIELQLSCIRELRAEQAERSELKAALDVANRLTIVQDRLLEAYSPHVPPHLRSASPVPPSNIVRFGRAHDQRHCPP